MEPLPHTAGTRDLDCRTTEAEIAVIRRLFAVARGEAKENRPAPARIYTRSTLARARRRCGRCGEFNHDARTCAEPAPLRASSPCPRCGELGHYAKTCRVAGGVYAGVL